MSPGNNRMKKQHDYVDLFDSAHQRGMLTPAEENKKAYDKVMKAAKEKEFDFWEVEYECPDPGPYPDWAFDTTDGDKYRLTPHAVWSHMVAEKKREYEESNPTKWYKPPQKSNDVEGWLAWVMNFNEKTDDEKQADNEWSWDGNHKLYLPKNNAWYRINKYLLREAEYSGLLHWSKSRIPPDQYYNTKSFLERKTTVSLEFVYHHDVENNFHELLCDYDDLKSLPLLTNDYAHETKLENGTKYHISLAQGWALEEDDARPEKPYNTWNYDEWDKDDETGEWKHVQYKLSLRDRLSKLATKWSVKKALSIPRIRVTNGGTYEFHNPTEGPPTSDDLAELAEFIKDAYKTSKPGVAPHVSFD